MATVGSGCRSWQCSMNVTSLVQPHRSLRRLGTSLGRLTQSTWAFKWDNSTLTNNLKWVHNEYTLSILFGAVKCALVMFCPELGHFFSRGIGSWTFRKHQVPFDVYANEKLMGIYVMLFVLGRLSLIRGVWILFRLDYWHVGWQETRSYLQLFQSYTSMYSASTYT